MVHIACYVLPNVASTGFAVRTEKTQNRPQFGRLHSRSSSFCLHGKPGLQYNHLGEATKHQRPKALFDPLNPDV